MKVLEAAQTRPRRSPPDATRSTPRIGILGRGLITPLGIGADDTWTALLAGKFIGDHSRVPLQFDATLPRVSHLAVRAAREAIASANWSGESLQSDRTALVVGTSK